MPLPITHVYEVVDHSDEEQYFTLGIYIDESAAREILDTPFPPSNESALDCVTIQVRKRPLGWFPHELGDVIAQRTWTLDWSEEKSPCWKCKPPRPHSSA